MDLKIQFGTSLSPQEKVVDKTVTVRDLFQENDIAFQDGQVTLNGRVLGTAEMNKTLDELGVKDNDYILAVNKHDNGQTPIQ